MDLPISEFRIGFYAQIVIAILASLVLYFAFKKRTELSRLAIENSFATIVVAHANLIVLFLFIEDINQWMQSIYGALRIPTLPSDFWDGWPYWLICVMAIMTKDFVDYWNHRVMHTKWLWPTHAAHHSDTHVNALTALRVHALEHIVMTASYIVLLTWLQVPHIIPVVATFLILLNFYVHLDLEFDHGPLQYVIASPVFHRWHHADVPEAYGKNLANVMPIYDVIFGTYYNPGVCRAPMGATSSGIEDRNPVSILIYPFQEWARLVRALFDRSRNDQSVPVRRRETDA